MNTANHYLPAEEGEKGFLPLRSSCLPHLVPRRNCASSPVPLPILLLPTLLPLSLLCGFLLALPSTAIAQTVYAAVLGNQGYVVGSSTLRSGLFVSRDGATTWRHVGPENLKAYSMDAVDTSGGRILYIAAGNGVHRSTDYGQSWKIVTDWQVTEVLDVKVDQQHPNYVYAATAWGFWRSTDGGETWENPGGPVKERYCYQIMLDSASAMVAVVGDGPRQQARYFSFNNGASWTEFANSMPGRWTQAVASCPVPLPNALLLMGFADSTGFHLDPAMPLRRPESSTATVDTAGIGGSNPGTQPIHALALLAGNAASTLLAGTFGDGLYKWTGREWSRAGLEGSQIWRIIVKDYTVSVEAGHVHEK